MKTSAHVQPVPAFGRKRSAARSIAEDGVEMQDLATHASAPHANETGETSFRFSNRYYELRKLTLSSLFAVIGEDVLDRHARSELQRRVEIQISSAAKTLNLDVETQDLRVMVQDLIHDLIGLGPLEDLLVQDDITDIMVVGPKAVYFERKGAIIPTGLEFQDEAHLRSIS